MTVVWERRESQQGLRDSEAYIEVPIEFGEG